MEKKVFIFDCIVCIGLVPFAVGTIEALASRNSAPVLIGSSITLIVLIICGIYAIWQFRKAAKESKKCECGGKMFQWKEREGASIPSYEFTICYTWEECNKCGKKSLLRISGS